MHERMRPAAKPGRRWYSKADAAKVFGVTTLHLNVLRKSRPGFPQPFAITSKLEVYDADEIDAYILAHPRTQPEPQ